MDTRNWFLQWCSCEFFPSRLPFQTCSWQTLTKYKLGNEPISQQVIEDQNDLTGSDQNNSLKAQASHATPTTDEEVVLQRFPEFAGILESFALSISRSPLPSAEELTKLEKLLPGITAEMVSMTKKDQDHRHSLETAEVKTASFVARIEALTPIIVFTILGGLLLFAFLSDRPLTYSLVSSGVGLGMFLIIRWIKQEKDDKWIHLASSFSKTIPVSLERFKVDYSSFPISFLYGKCVPSIFCMIKRICVHVSNCEILFRVANSAM